MRRRSKTEELLDFEIAFYGRLLRAYPDFVDVLIPLGEAYTRRGLYAQGLEVDLRLTQLRGKDPVVWYNVACSYSLMKRVEESLEALQRAVQLGYADLAYMQKDPDLLNLRLSAKYRQFLAACTSAAVKTPPAPEQQPT